MSAFLSLPHASEISAMRCALMLPSLISGLVINPRSVLLDVVVNRCEVGMQSIKLSSVVISGANLQVFDPQEVDACLTRGSILLLAKGLSRFRPVIVSVPQLPHSVWVTRYEFLFASSGVNRACIQLTLTGGSTTDPTFVPRDQKCMLLSNQASRSRTYLALYWTIVVSFVLAIAMKQWPRAALSLTGLKCGNQVVIGQLRTGWHGAVPTFKPILYGDELTGSDSTALIAAALKDDRISTLTLCEK